MDKHFTDTATISRSSLTANTNKTTYSVAGTIACHIQPLQYDIALGQMGRDGKDYRLFSKAEVKIGDRIVDQNSKKYEVTGVNFYSFRNRQHYQADLRST